MKKLVLASLLLAKATCCHGMNNGQSNKGLFGRITQKITDAKDYVTSSVGSLFTNPSETLVGHVLESAPIGPQGERVNLVTLINEMQTSKDQLVTPLEKLLELNAKYMHLKGSEGKSENQSIDGNEDQEKQQRSKMSALSSIQNEQFGILAEIVPNLVNDITGSTYSNDGVGEICAKLLDNSIMNQWVGVNHREKVLEYSIKLCVRDIIKDSLLKRLLSFNKVIAEFSNGHQLEESLNNLDNAKKERQKALCELITLLYQNTIETKELKKTIVEWLLTESAWQAEVTESEQLCKTIKTLVDFKLKKLVDQK